MEKILIFIKHHLSFLWKLIEWSNGFLFEILFKSRMEKVLQGVFKEFAEPPFLYRRLETFDINPLCELVRSQPLSDLEYFHPHDFDFKSLHSQLKKGAFLMMGVFEGENIIGYFFLRFFINKKCFVGRLIDAKHRGLGIGKLMNNIMYETAWRMNFRCLSTISRKNSAVVKAHTKNKSMVVLKELHNDYLLIEFVKT